MMRASPLPPHASQLLPMSKIAFKYMGQKVSRHMAATTLLHDTGGHGNSGHGRFALK